MSNPNRIVIGLAHPNARNAEAFLNSWEEPFLPEEEGKNRFVFRSVISNTTVELLFFNSYQDADAHGAEHFNRLTEKTKWNINGSMLYAISGDDGEKVSSLASHFAGRE